MRMVVDAVLVCVSCARLGGGRRTHLLLALSHLTFNHASTRSPLVLQHTTSIVLKIILDYKKLDPPPPYKIIGRLKYLAHAWYGCNVILEGGEVCV